MIEKKKVLALWENESTKSILPQLFPASIYAPIRRVRDMDEARRLIGREEFDLFIILADAREGYGVQAAAQIAAGSKMGIILFVRPEYYDQACYQLREQMVFVLSLPVSRNVLNQTISIVEKVTDQMKKMDQRLLREKQKLRDEKLISRCKLMLIENYHWSEERAHHYIEKTAMDHSMTKALVSKRLLEMMDQRRESA